MSRKLPIFYSALLLTAVNLLLRLVGTSFQVFLSGRIGAEGIGLLQLVMSVGAMAMVAGTAGIRTACMYLTAEELGRKHPERVLWVLSGCIGYSLFFSVAVGSCIYIFAPVIAQQWIGNAQTVDSLRLFGAFLPVNCLTGVLVGYFTGAGRIGTLAAVEVAEQLCTMAATVALLSLWAGNHAERACQAVVVGSGLGTCLTLVSLVILRLLERQKSGSPVPMTRRLLHTALPLAAADDLRTGISTVENLMVPRRLALYPGSLTPLAAFGTVCGMVFPVLMFPMAILFGLTELLVPELARCNAAGSRARRNYLVRRSLKVALLFGTVCGGILFLNADGLCTALYQSADAGRYLKWFAPLAVMLYCDGVTDAMIKGLGQQKISVVFNICTNVLDVALLFLLLPKFGIWGYFISFALTHAINFALSIGRLLHITGLKTPLKAPILCLSCAALAAVPASFAHGWALRSAGYILIWGCSLFLLKVLKKADVEWLWKLIKPANTVEISQKIEYDGQRRCSK